MPRLSPLPIEHTPDLREHFNFFVGTLGFVPNSVLTMQRRPKLVKALAALNGAAMDPDGEIDLGFRRLVGHFASKAAGCQYCMAHTVLGAKNFGIDEARLAALWEYASSPLFTDAERVALEFAGAAAQVPNAVTDELFARLQKHWTDNQIVELLGVIALFGFLNRWNDTMATPIEPPAEAIGDRFLPNTGWKAGKHRA
ncbi:MAG: carboxymuconolactone decarboxylase family protein [Burkholderiales bacterium]